MKINTLGINLRLVPFFMNIKIITILTKIYFFYRLKTITLAYQNRTEQYAKR